MTIVRTLLAWTEEGTRLFGEDKLKWRFVCPVCGFVATPADWFAEGAGEGAVAFSCIGRYGKYQKTARKAFGGDGPGPCDYTGGGLFALNPIEVIGIDKLGKPRTLQLFGFEGQET
jgi:hypothetical protein